MSQFVNIADITAAGDQLAMDVHLPAGSLDGETLAKPLDARVNLRLTQPWLLVKGTGDAEVTLECDRCGKTFNHPVHLNWEEVMEVTAEVEPPTEPHELTMEEAHERLDPDAPLDVSDLVRQQVLLALPTKRLCQAACQNSYLKAPTEKPIDPRWAALEALKRDHVKRGE